jgi:protein-S-isoprenylcysteine O-methyltransferase Ste14
MIELGRFLYRFRAWTAVPFFIVLVILMQPATQFPLSLVLVIPGLLVRFWAAGYIGPTARSTRFTSEYRIVNGPYQYLKHPLYLGNFLLVLGVVILFNPPIWYGIIIVAVFVSVYALILKSELHYLNTLTKRHAVFKWTNAQGELSTISVVGSMYLVYFVFTRFSL